jgi:hypothetical protein
VELQPASQPASKLSKPRPFHFSENPVTIYFSSLTLRSSGCIITITINHHHPRMETTAVLAP